MITTLVNGRQVGETALTAPEFNSYEVIIPGSAMRSGENLIEFRYVFANVPAPGAAETREIGLWGAESLAAGVELEIELRWGEGE